MVHVYCKAHHDTKGNELCPECTEFLEYAFLRLDKCSFQEEKSAFGRCLVKSIREYIQYILHNI